MKILLPIILLLMTVDSNAQSLAERLGYSENDKLLIIHSDDIGVSHSENMASFLAMKIGSVNSGSIMMPTPWVPEVAAFAKEYPTADLGLHLTLTSEWENIEWGPVAPTNKVSSLINEYGYLYDDCLAFGQNADPKEAEIELRAQIDLAYKLGIQPTHLDTHMGCLLFNSADLFESYLKVGRDYQIPVMLSRTFIQIASPAFKEKITDQDVIIESVLSANPQDFESGMEAYYEKTLNDLEAGVHVLLIHTAFDDAESQSMFHPVEEWGANWRQQDFNFFTSAKCAQLIRENNIKLVTWREIQNMMYKKP